MAAKGDPLVGIVAQYQVQKTQKRCRFGPNVPLVNAKTLLGVTHPVTRVHPVGAWWRPLTRLLSPAQNLAPPCGQIGGTGWRYASTSF
jgi:hypothetical protein